MAGVILDAVAVSDGAHHLHVEHGPLPHALRFDIFALLFEFRFPPRQFFENAADGALFLFRGQDVVRLGIYGQSRERLAADFAGQRIDGAQTIDLIAPHLDAKGVIFVGRTNLDHVTANTKSAAAEILATFVLNLHEAPQNCLAGNSLTRFQHHQHSIIGFRRTQAVNAGDRSYDDDVAALEKRARGAHAQLIQFVVDGGFLFDVGVGSRYVGFGLVIIVVADEIFDCILRKEIAKFMEELGGQRFVVREHQGRPAHLLDDLGHGESLARAGHSQQHLMLFATLHAVHQFPNGLGLVAARLVIAGEMKIVEVHGYRKAQRRIRAGAQMKNYTAARVDAAPGRLLVRLGRVRRQEFDSGVRLDVAGVTNGPAGGICNREIDPLGAVLGNAHGRMRLQGDIAKTFSGTSPAARGAQSIVAVVLGGGIPQLFLRKNGLAGKNDSAKFPGGTGFGGFRRLARLVAQIGGIATPDHAGERHRRGGLRGIPALAEGHTVRSDSRSGNLRHPLLGGLANLIIVDYAFESADIGNMTVRPDREFDGLTFQPLVPLLDLFTLRVGAIAFYVGGGMLIGSADAHGRGGGIRFRARRLAARSFRGERSGSRRAGPAENF